MTRSRLHIEAALAEAATESTELEVSLPRPYAALPPTTWLADTTAMQETEAAPSPTMGRDAERDFMLRYAG